MTTELVARFDALLADPDALYERVLTETAAFPEGDLFGLVYPALGYVNLALAGDIDRTHAAESAATLLHLATRATEQVLRSDAPDGVRAMASYSGHATYLGQLNMGLSAYALIGDDPELLALNDHLSELLGEAINAEPTAPLESYPDLVWPFDTVPVLVSLQLHDARTTAAGGDPRWAAGVARHLTWSRTAGTDPELQLPYSVVETGGRPTAPRGCDIALRIALVAHVDSGYASTMYERFVDAFWLNRGVGAGFAEWANGADRGADADSGPILFGIGFAASGFGVAAANALDDQQRVDTLLGSLDNVSDLLGLYGTLNPSSPYDLLQLSPEYTTGFYLGDALLFFALTWEPWLPLQ